MLGGLLIPPGSATCPTSLPRDTLEGGSFSQGKQRARQRGAGFVYLRFGFCPFVSLGGLNRRRRDLANQLCCGTGSSARRRARFSVRNRGQPSRPSFAQRRRDRLLFPVAEFLQSGIFLRAFSLGVAQPETAGPAAPFCLFRRAIRSRVMCRSLCNKKPRLSRGLKCHLPEGHGPCGSSDLRCALSPLSSPGSLVAVQTARIVTGHPAASGRRSVPNSGGPGARATLPSNQKRCGYGTRRAAVRLYCRR
jgi:hypothetical protein